MIKGRYFGRGLHLLVLVCAMIFALIGLVAVVSRGSPAGAVSPPAVAVGPLTCHGVAGKVHFKPPLLNGGGVGMSTATFSGQLSGCSGSTPAISAGTFKGSLSVPTNCDEERNGFLLGPASFTVKWTVATKVAETVVATGPGNNNGQFQLTGAGPGSDNFSLGGSYSTNTVTGSFAANNPEATDLATTPTFIFNSCIPKTKGLAGSGGLKSLTIWKRIPPLLFYLLAVRRRQSLSATAARMERTHC